MEKVVNLVNCTPHAVNIVGENGSITLVIEPSGKLIRLSQTTEIVGNINDIIKITRTVFGSTELPEKKEDTMYIVSQLIKSAFPDRDDLLVPAEVVRDEKGNIVGCKSLGV